MYHTGNTKRAAQQITGAIGLSSSTIFSKFTEASTVKMKEFQERDFSGLDVVTVFLEGNNFAEDRMIMALGVTVRGEKVYLSFLY